MTAASLFVLWFAAQPIITSYLDCPGARDIASQLSVLLPDTAETGRVMVSATADGLLVDLRPDNPTFAALRTVTVGSDCDERARAAAVVISTWWPVARPQPAPTEAEVAVAASPVALSPRVRRYRLGVAAFASVISDGTAAGGRLAAGWRPRDHGFGVRAAAAYTGSHTSAVGDGQARWSRATIELGPSYSLGHFGVDGGGVASAFWIRGTGFDLNQTSRGSAMGLTLGAGFEWPVGRLVPFVEARGFLWPWAQAIYVAVGDAGTRTSHGLPRVELQLGGGVALAF